MKSRYSQPFAAWVGGALEAEAHHGEGDYGLGHLGQVLVVPEQAAPAAEPAERPLDNGSGRAFETLWTLTMQEVLIFTFSDSFLAIGCCFVVATLMVPLICNAARAAVPSADAQ